VEAEQLTVVSTDDADRGEWDLLLDSIDSGSVVPIVGRDLLTTSPDAPETLYDVIATRLAKKLQVPPEVAATTTTSPLNAVASHYILGGGDPDDI
jgi:hypothetical protein